jgi:hypothetical protein
VKCLGAECCCVRRREARPALRKCGAVRRLVLSLMTSESTAVWTHKQFHCVQKSALVAVSSNSADVAWPMIVVVHYTATSLRTSQLGLTPHHRGTHDSAAIASRIRVSGMTDIANMWRPRSAACEGALHLRGACDVLKRLVAYHPELPLPPPP